MNALLVYTLLNKKIKSLNISEDSLFDGKYSSLTDQPQINGITLTGNKTLEDLGITKAITDAIRNVTQISFEVVESFSVLPPIGEVGTFYLVPNIARANNNYNEYIWDVNHSQYELIGTIQSDIDLSNYYNKSQVDELVDRIENKIERKVLVNTDTLKIIAQDGICMMSLLGAPVGTDGKIKIEIPEKYYPITFCTGSGFVLHNGKWCIANSQISAGGNTIDFRCVREDKIYAETVQGDKVNSGIVWLYKI